MFHPTYTYINKTVQNFEAIPLLVDIFKEGQLVYQLPTLSEIQEYARKNYDQLWMNTSVSSIHSITQLTWQRYLAG